jgi:NAD(P)-dependent dehydrogenase (short-subunit alcohol dehydrogenase family)
MSRLAGKRALITGGTSGIGLETAKQFLAEGAQVIVTGVTPANIDKARVELGDQALVLNVDAADMTAQRDLARTVQDRFGDLDIAFLNAGVSDWRPMEAHDEASFDRLFDVNVKSVFFLMQALIPVLNNPASVVLNSSASAHTAAATANAYAATKGAVSALMRSWNADLLKSHGVRVNAISPGPIATPFYDNIPADHYQSVMESIRAGIPLGRLGEAEEIAKAVVYLACDESRFTVGADLVIDGGVTIF